MGVDLATHYKEKTMEWFFESYDKLPKPTWEYLARKEEIDGRYTIESSLISMGKMLKKPAGTQFDTKTLTEGFPIMRSKGDAFGYYWDISHEDVLDSGGKIDRDLKKVTREWSEDAHRTKEIAFHDMFTYGGYTAGHATFDMSVTGQKGLTDPSGLKCYDGFPFFTPTGAKRSNKNFDTYFNAHNLGLNPTNLDTVFLNHTATNAYNERGEKIVLIPDILLVPQSMRTTVKVLLESEWAVGLAQNDINPWKGSLEAVVDPWLTSPTAWMLGTKKKGLWYWDGGEPEIDVFENKMTKGYTATIWFRFRAGIDNWRYWSGSNFATSA